MNAIKPSSYYKARRLMEASPLQRVDKVNYHQIRVGFTLTEVLEQIFFRLDHGRGLRQIINRDLKIALK